MDKSSALAVFPTSVLTVNRSSEGFTASAAYHGGRFRCLVSGLNASMNSKEAGFAFVSGAPVFDTSVDTLVKGIMGSEVTLVAKVSGATSCQWQINPNRGVWGNISARASGQGGLPSLWNDCRTSDVS